MLQIAGKAYRLYDVHRKCDCVVIARWHNVYRKKKRNAKVRNHNLKGSENEMNRKVLNFIKINKNEWLAISTT